MTTIEEVKSLLAEILQLGERRDMLDESTALLGSLPELDSMAVATVIAGIEDRFDGFVYPAARRVFACRVTSRPPL